MILILPKRGEKRMNTWEIASNILELIGGFLGCLIAENIRGKYTVEDWKMRAFSFITCLLAGIGGALLVFNIWSKKIPIALTMVLVAITQFHLFKDYMVSKKRFT